MRLLRHPVQMEAVGSTETVVNLYRNTLHHISFTLSQYFPDTDREKKNRSKWTF
jgi:hypothetical protein